MRASVIVPAFNAGKLIANCLRSLQDQTVPRSEYEVVVVDDGSSDSTAAAAEAFPGVKVVRQQNQGPAAARNRGAGEARAAIVLFTDSDCIPARNWMEEMLRPFDEDPDVIGAKGRYLTRQPELVARFVQAEYEDKYRLLGRHRFIDFIDTYSACFRTEVFLQFGGYDTSFPVACAEDVELSYRMANQGLKMVYVPGAVVYHQHPSSWGAYFNKKYKFAYWRMLAVRKNPNKAISDTHTPQLMKVQLLLAPAAVLGAALSAVWPGAMLPTALALALFLAASLPFAVRAMRKDPAVAAASPWALFMRALYQFAGVARGSVDSFLLRKH